MKLHPVRLLYIEIAILLLVTVATYVAVRQTISQPPAACGSNAFAFLPYTRRYAAELCQYRGLIEICSAYYLISILVFGIFQIVYLKGRQKLQVLNKKFFFACLFILAFSMLLWIVGQPDNMDFYNFKFHEGNAIGVFAMAVAIPCFQFILSYMLLSDSGVEKRHANRDK